jgi:hypothetical protein
LRHSGHHRLFDIDPRGGVDRPAVEAGGIYQVLNRGNGRIWARAEFAPEDTDYSQYAINISLTSKSVRKCKEV